MENKRRSRRIIILLIISNIVLFIIGGGLGFLFGKTKMALGTVDKNSASYQEEKRNIVRSYIEKNYLRDVDEDKIFEGQLKGMVAALEDPYSGYLTEDELNKMMEDTSGVFGGIGVVVSPGEDGFITVVSPIKDSPGEKAGLKSGDRIIKVDGKEYLGEEMDKAVKQMRGKIGEDVKLTILRGEKGKEIKEMEFTLTREEIKTETVDSKLLENKIGYIRISSFEDVTHDDFMEHLEGLEAQKAEKLIIDLRNNPGGVLDGVADIADELLDKGTIVYTENKDGERKYLKSNSQHRDLPLVVLVNGGSASASEILAGAIQDHNRGKVVGTTSYGKGVVQRIERFPDGSGIKLTISEYFTPKGRNIHGIGIKPDLEVKLGEDVQFIGPDNLKEDLQLQKAIEILK